MDIADEIRDYWEADSATYDDSAQHRPRDPTVLAAWSDALALCLPDQPAKVLDCGAGTGFLSITAARLGHDVTALDVSEGMLARLDARARADGLQVRTVVGPAADPPPGDFDVVVERHVLWTLPDPAAALTAWRAVAPRGRLVLVESLWGDVDPLERMRALARRALRRLQATPPEHHAEYPTRTRAALPLGSGTHPSRLAQLVAETGWGTARVRRLRDVEWAERQALPLAERIVGVVPRFVVLAG